MHEVQESPVYKTLLGRNPGNPLPYEEPVVIELVLPNLGEHDFKWVFADAIERTYFHYGFRLHPKGSAANVHVYGERGLIEHLAKTGKPARCELELVKKTIGERTFVLANLYLVPPSRRVTHEFGIVTISPKKATDVMYTTLDMKGMTFWVDPLQ